MSQDATALAREHTSRAIQALADVLDSDFSEPREVIAAANALLDRAHGKPSQAVIMVPSSSNEEVGRKLASMSDAELLIALGEARRARAAALPPIEGTVQVVPSGDLRGAVPPDSPAQTSPRADRFLPHLLKRVELPSRESLRAAAREKEYVAVPAEPEEFPLTDPLAM